MACETPVNAAEVGGIPEIVVPGETGILVPFEAEGGDRLSRAIPSATSRAWHRNQRVDGRTRRRTAMGKASERAFSPTSAGSTSPGDAGFLS